MAIVNSNMITNLLCVSKFQNLSCTLLQIYIHTISIRSNILFYNLTSNDITERKSDTYTLYNIYFHPSIDPQSVKRAMTHDSTDVLLNKFFIAFLCIICQKV